MKPRLALGLALLVAVPLVGNSALLALPADPPAHRHSIEPIEESDVPSEAEIHQYDDLSPEARHVIDAALASSDGHTTVTGEANRPPEFHYSDYAQYGSGMYVIEKGGTYYELTTYAGTSIDVRPIQRGLFVALGFAVVFVGVAGYRAGMGYVPVVVAVAAALPLLPVLAGLYRSTDAAVLLGTLGALGVCLVGGLLLAWTWVHGQ
ncbi:hypothetical protein HUG10_11780 [Halorarum halophilum]|uniref:DUF7979 domain-containing protein n=1 Tax=Halorarum halophilum TaxID=2743090 RepID=A0A7D5GFF4_9EURY|nr:hypothetical protein [Halobaculum halophilum]QLG28188.1 hypothetical protein HUG10_11780 [Halobaculum halophilum]